MTMKRLEQARSGKMPLLLARNRRAAALSRVFPDPPFATLFILPRRKTVEQTTQRYKSTYDVDARRNSRPHIAFGQTKSPKKKSPS